MESTHGMIREPRGEVFCPPWQLVRSFLKLGTVGFGGPVTLVGSPRRVLVESRKWLSETDSQEGLALARLRAVVFGSRSPCQADRSAQNDGLHASALQCAADPGGLCTDLSAGSSIAPGSPITFTHGCAHAPGGYDSVGLSSGADCRGLCDLPGTQCQIGNQSGHLRLAITGTGSRAWDIRSSWSQHARPPTMAPSGCCCARYRWRTEPSYP
jgi:hypothetical protein